MATLGEKCKKSKKCNTQDCFQPHPHYPKRENKTTHKVSANFLFVAVSRKTALMSHKNLRKTPDRLQKIARWQRKAKKCKKSKKNAHKTAFKQNCSTGKEGKRKYTQPSR